MIPCLNRMVSFRTVRPTAAIEGKQESQATASTLLRTLSASAKGEQQKVHVRWNVKSSDLLLLNQKLDADVGDFRDTDPTTATLLRHSAPSLDAIGTIDIVDPATYAAYEDGQIIEYFSATHKLWMSGTVSIEACLSGGNDPQHCIQYHVTLANGQLREDIGLDLLRSPLGPNELVECSSGQQAGQRLAATIAGDQSALPSRLGCRVVLEGQSPVNVPLLKLKRRFPRGRCVQVYRGLEVGWQMAKVHHSASADGCDAEILPLPGRSAQADVLIAHGMIERDIFAPGVSVPSDEAHSAASQLAIWTSVPICDVSGEEDESPEYVPSYLLRLSSIQSI